LYEYEVLSSSGDKIGSVDGVWVDDATSRLEFISVKTGWAFGKDHVVPIASARGADEDHTIEVPYSAEQVKNGPSFAVEAPLSQSDEDQIYGYYGLKRSTAESPSGYASGAEAETRVGTGRSGTAAGRTAPGRSDAERSAARTSASPAGTIPSDRTELEIPQVSEELEVGKRAVQAGEVRLHKVVRIEHEEVPVELRREEVRVERTPASGGKAVPGDAFEEQDVTIPVMEERPVVSKEARVTGEVRVKKDVDTEQRKVGGDVRKTDVEIDKEGDIERGPSRSKRT
jgi:uncharacterized protein (TIGR02271 family)